MHQLLCFKNKFLNHFAFTLGCYLFLLLLVQIWDEYSGCLSFLHETIEIIRRGGTLT